MSPLYERNQSLFHIASSRYIVDDSRVSSFSSFATRSTINHLSPLKVSRGYYRCHRSSPDRGVAVSVSGINRRGCGKKWCRGWGTHVSWWKSLDAVAVAALCHSNMRAWGNNASHREWKNKWRDSLCFFCPATVRSTCSLLKLGADEDWSFV